MKPFTVVAYYTDDNYKAEAQILEDSLIRLGLRYRIKKLKCRGTWHLNTCQKADFIKDMLRVCDGPILYTDADSAILHYPDLIDRLDCDFAAHIFKGNRLASGTMYFHPGKAVDDLIFNWKKNIGMYCNTLEQDNLHTALKETRGISFFALPVEYCYFDLQPPVNNPVVVHRQASRRLRNVNRKSDNPVESQCRNAVC